MRKAHWFGALALGVVLAGAGPAQAQVQGEKSGGGKVDPARRESIEIEGSSNNFGAPAQIVVSDDFSASVGFTTRGTDRLVINLAPALDYFIVENISIGAAVSLAWDIGEGNDAFNIGLAGRVGYAIPLREAISLWPRLSLGFQRLELVGGAEGSDTNTDFIISGYVPALVHITPNFFFGAGPEIIVVPGGDASGLTLAVRTTLGGNF